MNQTQINNFLLCLTHIDDANYLRLHTRAINATKTSSSALHNDHEHDHVHDREHKHDDHDHDHDSDSHDLLVSKIVAMVVLFCATSLIGSIPFLLNRHFKWTENNANARSATVVKCLLYFGGGVLLCTTFLHLLPEVQETIENLQECGALPELSFALAEMLMCGGFFLMYLVEELIHSYIHRHKRLLETDAAGAAFERGHSVRNSYLVKGGKQEQQPQIASAPPPAALDLSTSVNMAKIDGTNDNIGLSAQDLIGNDFNQHKYQQEQQSQPTKYSDQSQQLDHHHNHNHHHHHHHDHDCEHQHHHLGHGHSHLPPLATESDTDLVTSSLRGLLIVLALSLHELFEGMAIGLEGSASDVWFMFGAVSAHKLVLAFCVAVELIVARTRLGLSIVYVLTFGIVSPIGIGIGILVSHNSESTAAGIPSAILQGLACGTLLYVVFFEILSKNRSGLLAYLSLFVGFAVMFGLQQIGTQEHGHSHGGCGTHDHEDMTKAFLFSGGNSNMGNHHSHFKQHQDHNHGEHADHSHQPATTTTTAAAPASFEQQLAILREASRELLSSIKKNT